MGVRVGVLGIGNILLSDDGIGVHIVRSLGERYRFTENVRLIDGGTMGLDLLPFLEDIDRLLIIDAVDLKKPPGTTEIITGDRIPLILNSKLSVHQIGLSDLMFVIRMKELPVEEICLIGIQPASLGTGTEPSDELKEVIDKVIDCIVDKLREWDIKVSYPCP